MADTSKKLETTELLYNCALSMGLRPSWLKRNTLFSISTPAGEQYVYAAKSVINSQLSGNLTQNKLATRLILEQRGLPSIPYMHPANLAEARQFLSDHSRIIVKPLTGSNSHDVHIVCEPEELQGFDLPQYILEKYIPGREVRYLILDSEVIGVHESDYGESVAETRPLKRISYPASRWDTQLAALSLKTAAILGLRYAAVDYIIGPEGQAQILEVNSSPGMKWFHAPSSGPKVDVARLFLEALMDSTNPSASRVLDTLATSPRVAYS
jgi:glutathione synthase/RimK-type ligase-like ATP-grasp enzyme